MQKTWAEKLEEALPNADEDLKEWIMNEYCPYNLFGEDSPEFTDSYYVYDKEACSECWRSCNRKCTTMVEHEGETE